MKYSRIPIREWAVEDRPREKLMKRGLDAMTDAELIAILLGSGSRDFSALDLARQTLQKQKGLRGLAGSSFAELTKIKGIGPAKAIGLVTAFELGRRKLMVSDEEVKIRSSSDVAQYLKPKLADRRQEVFCVLFINRANIIKGEKLLFHGGLNASVVDVRVLFREAIQHDATSIIVAHNHPSGNLKPSQADIRLTSKLYESGRILDLDLLDHLIISRNGYYSFADEGMIG